MKMKYAYNFTKLGFFPSIFTIPCLLSLVAHKFLTHPTQNVNPSSASSVTRISTAAPLSQPGRDRPHNNLYTYLYVLSAMVE